MQRSSEPATRGLKIISRTIPDGQIGEILSTPGIFFEHGHFLYPVSDGKREGSHLDAIFLIEPIARKQQCVQAIVDDICRWIKKESIEFDVVFAPSQAAVKTMAERLAARTGKRAAFWEYLPTGWFGEKLESGEIRPGDRVLVFNAVTQQGKCIGERLPEFAKSLGGETVAAAVVAKGTGAGVQAAEKRFGSKLYATIQVDIQVQPPDSCTICAEQTGGPPVPWTDMRDRGVRP